MLHISHLMEADTIIRVKKQEVIGRKLSRALTSKTISFDPNLPTLMKSNNYKLNKAIFKNSCSRRTELNQPVNIDDRMLNRAVSRALRQIVGNHKKDVVHKKSLVVPLESAGHKYKILTKVVDGQDFYKVFLYSAVSAIKGDGNWRPHIYVDMSHLINDVDGFIGRIATLDASDELAVLAAIHWQSENMDNYTTSIFSKIATHKFPLS